MATTIDLVREETGLDLADAELVVNTLAPQFAGRLNNVLGDLERAQSVVRKIFSAYQGLTATASPLAVYALAAKAGVDAYNWIQGLAQKAQDSSLLRRSKTRAKFVEKYYKSGSWSQVLGSKAPSPADLDLSISSSNSSKQQKHLNQYDPYFVFHVSRVARPSVLNPTWSTPPYSSPGVTPATWGGGISYSNPTLLGGFTYTEGILGELFGNIFQDRPQGIGPIPGKYQDNYWGNSPGGGSIDSANPFDGGLFINGYAPPPGYQYLFSWGTYPYSGWFGPPGGPEDWTIFDLSAEMAAMAGAIHSLTPIHARIPYDDVAIAYRGFVAASGIRNIPLAPIGQIDMGVYLSREDLLPFSNTAGQRINTPTGFQIPWEVLREIELTYRNWFALRRAAVYQFQFTVDAFKQAAKDSLDPTLRSLGKGGSPPEYQSWREWDPVGDGWNPGIDPAPKPKPKIPSGKAPAPKKPGPGLGGVGELSTGKSSQDSAGPILIAGAAAAAAYFLLR